MGMFNSLSVSASGMDVYKTWIDAISDNVANVNTTRPADEEPFRARQVVARSVEGVDGLGDGVRLEQISLSPAESQVYYDPYHPHADEFGLVQRSNVSLENEMTNLLLANRVYGMNIRVMERAVSAYRTALQIGR